MGTRPYTIDPQVAHERAVKAAAARNSVDNHIRKLVDAAPKLTPAQRDKLAALLRHSQNTSGGQVA